VQGNDICGLSATRPHSKKKKKEVWQLSKRRIRTSKREKERRRTDGNMLVRAPDRQTDSALGGLYFS
tara:strand:- start:1186 stop:1386 length:201 start_codon:yes stop_codon:yes gene_type:complete